MHLPNKLKQISTRAQKGAVVFVVLLSSYGAQAQECPEISLEQCDAPGYLETPCGQEQEQECTQLITDAFEAVYANTPNQHVTVLPESLGGDQQLTRFVPYSFSDQQVTNGGATYAGMVNKSQLISAKDVTDFTQDDQDFLAMKQSWAADGITVNSCEEFVYKRYYDYSVFEDTGGSFVFDDGERGSNYRAIFDAAFAPDGIAHRRLLSIDGEVIAFHFGESAIPKNGYYTFQVGPYPNGYPRYPFDRELISQVDPRGLAFYRPTFDWHQEMSNRFAHILDDELDLRGAEQKSFSRLMQSRRNLWERYQLRRSQILREGGDPTELDQQTAGELFEIDRDLEEGLRTASRNQCLTLDQPTVCDWSPRLFKEQLDAALLPPREDEFQRCVFLTGNDFGPDSYVHHAEVLGIEGVSGDQTTSPSKFHGFVVELEPLLPIDQITKDLMRGWSRSDVNNQGNAWFGVRYNYSVGAGLRDFWGPGSRMCDANAYINGAFNVDGTIVKQEVEVMRASAEARTEPNDLHVAANLRVAGVDIYNFDHNYPLSFNVTFSPKRSGDLLHVRYDFVIAFVPVKVEGGISGELGLEFSASGGLTRDCAHDGVQLSATETLKPWVELDAYVSAAVNLHLVSAGVKGTLVLVDLSLPLSENVYIYPWQGDPTRPALSRSSELNLNVEALSGKITLFVKVPFHTYESKLFDWSGFHSNTKLYKYSFLTLLSALR